MSEEQIQPTPPSVELHYNPKEPQQLKDLYLEEFNAWKSRQPPTTPSLS